MSKLNIKVTNALKFLREFTNDASDIYDECYSKMKDIDDIDEDDENYQNELRKATRKFMEDMDTTIDDMSFEYGIFMKDMSEIISNKHNDEVIYSLRSFSDYSDRIKKGYKNLFLKLDTRRDVASASKDYGRYIAYNKVYNIANKMNCKLEAVMKKCDTLTNEKNKDEE